MNQIAKPVQGTTAANGAGAESGRGDAALRVQARELDATFKSFAGKLLIDDDPASELPLRQLRVCAALLDGPLSMSELSRQLGVSQSAITQLADRLQSAGMVTRSPAGGDRRVRSLQLTTRARKILRLREENRIERVVVILRGMTDEARDGVVASMAALSKSCKP